jgi:hypothetical protein
MLPVIGDAMRGCLTGNRQRSVDGCSIVTHFPTFVLPFTVRLLVTSGIERCQTVVCNVAVLILPDWYLPVLVMPCVVVARQHWVVWSTCAELRVARPLVCKVFCIDIVDIGDAVVCKRSAVDRESSVTVRSP